MYDENFNKLIDFIFGVEKGYVNDKNDKSLSHNNSNNFNFTSNQLDKETEEQHKAMMEGFDSGMIADEDHGIKRLNHLLSEYNRDWKKQFNVGDPKTDKGHSLKICFTRNSYSLRYCFRSFCSSLPRVSAFAPHSANFAG